MTAEANVSFSAMLRALYRSYSLWAWCHASLWVCLFFLCLLLSLFSSLLSYLLSPFPPLCFFHFLAHVSPHAPHGVLEMFLFSSSCLSRSSLNLRSPLPINSAFPDVRHSLLLYFSLFCRKGVLSLNSRLVPSVLFSLTHSGFILLAL